MSFEELKQLLDDLTCKYFHYGEEHYRSGDLQGFFEWNLRAGGVQASLNVIAAFWGNSEEAGKENE